MIAYLVSYVLPAVLIGVLMAIIVPGQPRSVIATVLAVALWHCAAWTWCRP